MKRIEVRCCCQPQKLLGWLRYYGELPREFRFLVKESSPLTSKTNTGREFFVASCVKESILVLPIVEIALGNKPSDRYLAVKAEHTPIETLRNIPHFEENKLVAF